MISYPPLISKIVVFRTFNQFSNLIEDASNFHELERLKSSLTVLTFAQSFEN